jgi:hypothetical protein
MTFFRRQSDALAFSLIQLGAGCNQLLATLCGQVLGRCELSAQSSHYAPVMKGSNDKPKQAGEHNQQKACHFRAKLIHDSIL